MIPFDNKRQDKRGEERRGEETTSDHELKLLSWLFLLTSFSFRPTDAHWWLQTPRWMLILTYCWLTTLSFSFRLDDWLRLLPRPDQARPGQTFSFWRRLWRDETILFPRWRPYRWRPPNLTTRFHGVVGYHIILTWWGSPDRTRVEPFLLDLLTLDSSLLHLWWDAPTSLPLIDKTWHVPALSNLHIHTHDHD